MCIYMHIYRVYIYIHTLSFTQGFVQPINENELSLAPSFGRFRYGTIYIYIFVFISLFIYLYIYIYLFIYLYIYIYI